MTMTNDRIVDTLDRLRGLRPEYRAAIINALGGPKVGLKRWIANHDVLETLQVTYDEGRPTSAWWPGAREVDTSAASYVRLNGSRTDYREVKCISSSHDVWIGQYNDGTLIVHAAP